MHSQVFVLLFMSKTKLKKDPWADADPMDVEDVGLGEVTGSGESSSSTALPVTSNIPPHYPHVPPLPSVGHSTVGGSSSSRIPKGSVGQTITYKKTWLVAACRAIASADLLSTVDTSEIRAELTSRISASTSLDESIHVVILLLMRLYHSMEANFEATIPLDNLKRLFPADLVNSSSSSSSEPIDLSRLKSSFEEIDVATSQSFCPGKENDAACRTGIFVHDSTGKTYRTPKQKKQNAAICNEREMLSAFNELYPEWWQNTRQTGYRNRVQTTANYRRFDQGFIDLGHPEYCNKSQSMLNEVLQFDKDNRQSEHSISTDYAFIPGSLDNPLEPQRTTTRDMTHLNSASVICNGAGKASLWTDKREKMIDDWVNFMAKWPELQRLEIGHGCTGMHFVEGFDENRKKMFKKFQDKRLAIINYMGLIGLQLKADKWHALTDGDHGAKYARVLTRAVVGAWDIYYFLRTLEHSLSNDGFLPPDLYSRALVHFQENLSFVSLVEPHELVQNLVTTMENQLITKYLERSALLGKPHQPPRDTIPLDKLVFDTSSSFIQSRIGMSEHSSQVPPSPLPQAHPATPSGTSEHSSQVPVHAKIEAGTYTDMLKRNVPFSVWVANFLEDESTALNCHDISHRRYAQNCSYSHLFLPDLLAETYPGFEQEYLTLGSRWGAIQLPGDKSTHPFGGDLTDSKDMIKATFSRPFEFNLDGATQQLLAPCVHEGSFPLDTFGVCHEFVLCINPHFHPLDGIPSVEDQEHWAYYHEWDWRYCVFGKFCHPHPVTTCSERTLYMKGTFVFHPLFTDRHIMAEPVGHSTVAVSTMLQDIVDNGRAGCGLSMLEVAAQMNKQYWKNPATDFSFKSNMKGSAGRIYPDAEDFLFSCGTFQSFPWHTLLDPDECYDEALQDAPEQSGSFVYAIPIIAIETAYCERTILLNICEPKSINSIFNPSHSEYDHDIARINSSVIFAFIQNCPEYSFDQLIGQRTQLGTRLVSVAHSVPDWRDRSELFSFLDVDKFIQYPAYPQSMEVDSVGDDGRALDRTSDPSQGGALASTIPRALEAHSRRPSTTRSPYVAILSTSKQSANGMW